MGGKGITPILATSFYWGEYEERHAIAVSLAEQLSALTPSPALITTLPRQQPNPAPGAFSAFEEPGPADAPTRREVRQAAEDNTLLNRST